MTVYLVTSVLLWRFSTSHLCVENSWWHCVVLQEPLCSLCASCCLPVPTTAAPEAVQEQRQRNRSNARYQNQGTVITWLLLSFNTKCVNSMLGFKLDKAVSTVLAYLLLFSITHSSHRKKENRRGGDRFCLPVESMKEDTWCLQFCVNQHTVMIMNTCWAPHPIGGLNASQQQLETMNNKKIKLTKYTGVKSKQWKVLVPHKQEKIDSSEVFLTKVKGVYGLLKTFEWGYIIIKIFWQDKSSVLFLLCSRPQRRQYHRWWSKRMGKPKRRRRTKKTWSLPRPRKLWKHSQAQTVSNTVHSTCSFWAGMKMFWVWWSVFGQLGNQLGVELYCRICFGQCECD